MNPRDAQQIIREKGLCGRLLNHDQDICVLEKGHDDNAHSQPWHIKRDVREDDYGPGRDMRNTTTYYKVTDGVSSFETTNEANATWLMFTLNRAEQ